MTEIDSISIQRGAGGWVASMRLHYPNGGIAHHEFTIGDPGQFLDETQRVLGPWVAEDRLIEAMYATPPEPQSIRADLEENKP